jgi:hypothetical protein
MDDKAAVVADVCAALAGNQLDEAGTILRKRYPFVPLINGGRRYSVRQMLTTFIRDGFIYRSAKPRPFNLTRQSVTQIGLSRGTKSYAGTMLEYRSCRRRPISKVSFVHLHTAPKSFVV